jgi:hypothetical protein
MKEEWAWDATRIRNTSESFYEGDQNIRRRTKIWDGSLAVEQFASAEGDHKQYVLGDKLKPFFDEQVINMAYLPWGPGGAHHFWWLPVDIAKYRSSRYISPEDFEMVGQEELEGRPCYVVQSRAAHYRMHIGVADGRLYRRTSLGVPASVRRDRYLSLYQKIAGPSISKPNDWDSWLKSLESDERASALREFAVANFEFMRPRFHHTLDVSQSRKSQS